MSFEDLRKLGLTDAYEECSEVGYDLNLNERLNGGLSSDGPYLKTLCHRKGENYG